jgi:hypothetical protein
MATSPFRITIAALSLAAAGAASAADTDVPIHPALRDRFNFGVGGFFPKTATSAQLQSATGVGANVDFENALGITDSKSVPMAFGRWRFGERWRVEAEYFRLNRSGSKTLDRDIQWGDTVYPVNSRLDSKFDFSDMRISAGYSFFKRPDKEVGIGLGLHVAQYDVSLSGNSFATQSSAVTAPLPVLSIFSQFALTERWAVSARMDRFAMHYEDFDGSLTGLALDLMYQPFRNVGFGLGTRALALDASAKNDADRSARFRQTFQGPVLFVTVSF